LGITAFGQVLQNRAIKRSLAQVGNQIVITGDHGLSRGGLELLLNPDLADLLSAEQADHLRLCHQRPTARLDVSAFVVGCALEMNCTVAGMDSSDGLADGILQICQASGVSALIDWSGIRIDPAVQVLANDKAMDWVLYGGEDFELVLCLPPEMAEQVCSHFSSAYTIGQIVARDDPRQNLALLERDGAFRHFG
jgi:thiamine-monophosphate kinase